MVTSSPTRTPPVSRAVFQVSPKSLRLILAVAVRPMRVLPQGSLRGLTDFLDGQSHGLGHVTDGQVARNGITVAFVLNVGGLESHGGEFLCVEEVRALEMAVALRVLSVDGTDINGDFKGGTSVVGFVSDSIRR